jgi:crotonobetaine/carnitine-CoA ligase
MTSDDEVLRSWTLWSLAERRSELGDRALLTIEDDVLTYAELHDRALRLGAALVELGLRRGETVASFGYNSTDAVCVWFACAAVGAVWVPLNVSLVGGDLVYALTDCAAGIVVIDDELVPRLLEVEDQVRVDRVLVRGGSDVDGYDTFEDALRAAPLTSASPSGPSDPVAVVYTGGSTGMPKGVLVSNTYYLGSALRYREIASAVADDVHYSGGHQLFHSGGQQFAVVAPLFCEMESHLARWFSASKYWQRARDCGATIIDPIGPLIAAVMKQPESPADTDHRVRLAIGTATGQIDRSVREAFSKRFAVPLLEVYAQTETGGVLMCSERPGEERAGSSGRPGKWATLGIVDDEDHFLPPGTVGEIVVRPDIPNTFMIEYLNKPEQTARSWRNLWHHTGDLGHLDEDGYLYFIGRQAHWLRRRGENISSYEVEQCISRLDGVAECAVVGVPDHDLGDEDVKAFVVADPGRGPLDPEVIHEWCCRHLAYFKVPRYIEMIDELPRSKAKNEIERHVLRGLGVGAAWDVREHEKTVSPSVGPS